MVPYENETYVKSNSSILGSIIPKNKFLMSSGNVTSGYRNSGIFKCGLSNIWVFQI